VGDIGVTSVFFQRFPVFFANIFAEERETPVNQETALFQEAFGVLHPSIVSVVRAMLTLVPAKGRDGCECTIWVGDLYPSPKTKTQFSPPARKLLHAHFRANNVVGDTLAS
jgi:hypothetical protein